MILNDEIVAFICEHENDNIRELALQSGRYPHLDMPFILQQIAGRQIAQKKIPSWYQQKKIIYPQHLSLEQCSSEQTAIYKAELCSGDTFVDLTGGLGVDFYTISQKFKRSTYVEQNEDLIKIAQHNFSILPHSGAINVECGNSVDFLEAMPIVDQIYIDPARRSEAGRKTVLIEDCTPDIVKIQSLLDSKAKNVMIKLSPMLDISLALQSLSNISSVHIISVDNECKELLFIKNSDNKEEIAFHCVNISTNSSKSTFSFTKNDSKETDYTNSVLNYLYEPNASIMKAGAFQYLSNRFNLKKLHTNSHLFTSETLINDFPGRIFKVNQQLGFNKKSLKELQSIKSANLTVRNFPSTVAELRKKLKLQEGGNTYLFATTLANNNKVLLICEKTN